MFSTVSALRAVRRSRTARVVLATVAATAVGATALVGTASAADGCTRTISPGASVASAVQALKAGETLCLRGGTYSGDVSAVLGKGTATSPITVMSYPGERATLVGATKFLGGEHWRVRGLGFTDPGSTAPIVKLIGGVGWHFTQNEVYDGAYAGILVGRSSTYGVPHGYVISENVVRDTTASNLYHNPSRHSTGGLIERNLFFNSGTQNVKLGWGGSTVCSGSNYDEFGIGEVTFRYNTLYNGKQPLAIAESGGERRVDVHRNLIGKGTAGYGVRIDSVEGCLKDNVWVHDNAVFAVSKLAEDFGDQPTIMKQMTSNLMGIDPKFDSTTASGFHPTDTRVAGYGRYAGVTTTPTMPTEPVLEPISGVLVVPCPTDVAKLDAEVVLCA
ncbi:MAG: hypothetical protein ACLGIG_11690 [Actinomycetes bacterium]